MARKVGQIVRRGDRTWLVRVYNGRDAESKKRKYLNRTIHGGLRDAQSHLNKMLENERDFGRNLDSSRQTLNQFLDRWLEVCAKPRLRAKTFQDYEGLLRRYIRPRLGARGLFDCVLLRHPDALPRSACRRIIRPLNPVHARSVEISVQAGRCGTSFRVILEIGSTGFNGAAIT